ncbi:hypothetical protein B9Z65_2545 [Elsinoe australis]|uniref:Eukaryotic translation initiation factor 3 subunit J n=1 Tax=Elsinoe australis TaxID=40998 RepID=A0A2P8A3W8_9PEZI|nr:hypothetical protein B9Z65_2545 [Elsinoe australis]
MAPNAWDDEDSESTPPSSPPVTAAVRRGKFDDEEDNEDVLDSWDAAEDSEVEREKAKKAEEAKAKAEAEAKANHKSKAQRIEERRRENERRRMAEEESSEDDEDEAEKRARLRKTEQDSDLKHAEDLFGSIGISNNRGAVKPVTIKNEDDPTQAIDLSSLAIFNPSNKEGFTQLRETLVPLLTQNSKKAQYAIWLPEFVKQISKDLPSDQIKKASSALTTLSNEKMKEEKAAEKGGKKTKAAKTKASLAASRDVSYKADTTAYDDGLEDDDFM